MVKKSSKKVFTVLFILTCIADTARWNSLIKPFFPYFVLMVLFLFTFWFFIKFARGEKRNFEKIDNQLLRLYFIYVIISVLRGALFEANGYWEYKALMTNTFTLLLPICIYFFAQPYNYKYALNIWVMKMLPLFFILGPFLSKDVVGYYLAPSMTLALFLPCYKTKWKIVILICLLISIFSYFGARAIILKNMMVIILVVLFYYIRISERLMKIMRTLMIVFPMVFLFWGVMGYYNVFEFGEGLSGNYEINSVSGKLTEDLVSDTRTGIYMDSWNSLSNNNAVIWGVSPARGYECSTAYATFEILRQVGNTRGLQNFRLERSSSEVGIINIFCWEGILGVILFSLLFFRASYLAIYKSNNVYVKAFGVFCAFRWLMSFVEDYYCFDLKGMSLWWIIAICLSCEFRKMSDEDVKKWASGFFGRQ